MFSLTILGSGSAGNCALVSSAQCRLLIDGGLSALQMRSRLESAGVQPGDLDGILLTHEHGDHVGGLPVFLRKFDVPIYCNALTADVLRHGVLGGHRSWRLFATGSEFAVRDITVQTFPVPHDAQDPVGYALHCGNRGLGFLTDLGFATKLVQERIRATQTLVIETNHDEKLLQNDTRRPWSVKQRILSRHGHLSNDAAAAVVASVLGNGLRRVVLGHLSRDCNTPELAIGTVRARVEQAGAQGLEIQCALQREISASFPL